MVVVAAVLVVLEKMWATLEKMTPAFEGIELVMKREEILLAAGVSLT